MRMSPSEAMMWAVEKDPALRSDFCNLTVLDSLPVRGRLRATVERAIVAIPRLGRPRRLAAAAHRRAGVARRIPPSTSTTTSAGSRSPSRGRCATSSTSRRSRTAPPLDRSRPLWEFTLVEGLEGGRAALLQRLHHTITDGVGGMRLSLSLVDLEREPGAAADRRGAAPSPTRWPPSAATATLDDAVDRDSPIDVLREALGDAWPRRRSTSPSGARARRSTLATQPRRLPERVRGAAELLGSLRRQVLVTDRGHSRDVRGPVAGAALRHARRSSSTRSTAPARRTARASTTCSSPAWPARSPRSTASSASVPRRCGWRCR